MSPSLVAVGVCLAAVAGAVWAWKFIPQRRRLARFADREELSAEQIYTGFFATTHFPRALVSELWTEVALPLRVPPGKLRPSDRFDKELAPVKGWEFDDDIVEVCWAAERRLKKMGLTIAPANVHTLGDYVAFFCQLAANTQPAARQ